MRVLFCTLDYPPSAAGGAEQQARLQAEELVRRGHRIEVVCARTPGHRPETLNGVKVHRLRRVNVKYLRTVTYLFMLTVFLLRHVRRYELVHVHLANLQADVAVAISRQAGRPTYLKVAAGGPLGEIGRMRAVSAITRFFGLRHADAVQAISDEIGDDLARIGVAPERIHRIPNGVVVPPDPGPNERADARAALGLHLDVTAVIYLGRMERDKGVADLLAAWRRVARDDRTLLLIGSLGLKDPVGMETLPKGVDYRGWTIEARRYMAAADAFVLPSHAEGMSNALLEAMAAGLACVSTTVGAAPEMIRNGESGLLVPPKDHEALGAALESLLDDSELRARLGACARESVAATYGIERIVDQVEAAYDLTVRAA
jgi:glycosyltransferase involved in cell wall biosynthesis